MNDDAIGTFAIYSGPYKTLRILISPGFYINRPGASEYTAVGRMIKNLQDIIDRQIEKSQDLLNVKINRDNVVPKKYRSDLYQH